MNSSFVIVPLALLTRESTHCKLNVQSVPPLLTGTIWSTLALDGSRWTPLKAHLYSCFFIISSIFAAVASDFRFDTRNGNDDSLSPRRSLVLSKPSLFEISLNCSLAVAILTPIILAAPAAVPDCL
jgi:hypothetical protein